ncbi:MAG: acetylxylan esterase [Acidobacteria bacterium]|nr:acetylxylan esterase [Acidobacteriota bacterium]MDA1234390.1 acetylxylan esterase [Acidobacteriota bacterium]
MKALSVFAALLALSPLTNPLLAQEGELAAPVELTREQDHQRTMDLLGIRSLRQGANGRDQSAPNAANYDESKATPYPNLPDVLLTNGRETVTTPAMWWNVRRPEIVELFDREIYGRVPENTPDVKWEVASRKNATNGDVAIVTKELLGHVDNSAYPLINVDIAVTLVTPASAAGAVPVILRFGRPFTPRPGRPARPAPPGPTWEQQVLARGWGYAYLDTSSVQADNGAGLTQGIVGLVNKGQPRDADDWGALRAWAWGASRALDYFAADTAVDAKRVGIEGHSRWGKATLVAMAYDDRFAVAYISSSGAGGASLYRRNWGELVENVAAPGEYHWMAGNFMKYAGPLSWDDLPIDTHELVALCAPRPVFISSGDDGDQWVDAKGMFIAGAYAQPVYRLLGKKDMGTNEFPALEVGLMEGEISFRQHSAGHTDYPNWPTFLDCAARYF